MKTVRFLRRELLQLLLLAVPFALAAAWWNELPPVVVTHWALHGQPNGWMPKAPGLLGPPVLNVGICLLLAFLPRIHPRLRVNPALVGTRYLRVLRIYRHAITAVISLVSIAVIALAAGWRLDLGMIAVNGMLALFVVLGNYLGIMPPNYFLGCRPDDFPDAAGSWRAAQRTTGRLMFFGGLALLLVEPFVGRETELDLLIGYGGLLFVGSLGHAAWQFQRRRLA